MDLCKLHMSNVSDCGVDALGVFFGVNLWWQIHNVYHISVASSGPAGEKDPAHARLGRHSGRHLPADCPAVDGRLAPGVAVDTAAVRLENVI